MDEQSLTPEAYPPDAAARLWREDAVFHALSDGTRRRIIAQLATGAERGATELSGGTRMATDLTSKHLHVLAKAGIVIGLPSPKVGDRRRRLYRLHPALLPHEGARDAVDFGWCVLRLGR